MPAPGRTRPPAGMRPRIRGIPRILLAPQQSTTARTAPGCPQCGLDRRIRAENRSSPQRCTPSRTPQPWPRRESAVQQPSASTTKTSRRRTSSATAQPHGPNRESHDDIGTSPHRDRNVLGHQPRHHHRTAEFRQSTHTITISRRLISHSDHPTRGPNRKMRTENQSSPQQRTPSDTLQPRPHHKTAEFQWTDHIITINRRLISHPRCPKHGPNRKMQAKDQSSPQRHPPSTIHATMAAARIRSTSTICQHHEGQPPTHQPRNHPNPRTKPEIARRHRNQSTPASGHTRQLKLFTPIKSASASAVISPLLPTLRHPSASVEDYGIRATGFPRSDNT